jgi:hypothetical protein
MKVGGIGLKMKWDWLWQSGKKKAGFFKPA